MLFTRVFLRELELFRYLALPREQGDMHAPVREGQRVLHRFPEAGAQVGTENQTVDDDVNGVLFVLVERDLFGEVVEAPVHACADVTRALGVGKNLFVHTLLCAHDGGEYHEAAALRERENAVEDLVERLLGDLPPADRAVGRPDARVEQTQIVVDLRDRPDCGARVLRGRFLLDGNGGRKPLDEIHVRLVHLAEELAGIGRE